MQREGGLTGGFRAVNLHNPAAGQPADAQRRIQRHRTGRDALHIHPHILAQTHYRAFAEIFLYLLQRQLQSLFPAVITALFVLSRLFSLFRHHLSSFPVTIPRRTAAKAEPPSRNDSFPSSRFSCRKQVHYT